MLNASTEFQLFSKAIALTHEMILLMSKESSDYVEVTRLMIERGKVYEELDSLVKTLDRSNSADKVDIKKRYDELMDLDTNFRALLKKQSERLRSKSTSAKKDQTAHESYKKPVRSKESLFISSKLEG